MKFIFNVGGVVLGAVVIATTGVVLHRHEPQVVVMRCDDKIALRAGLIGLRAPRLEEARR